MLEIKPFTPADLDVVTRLAREQDFAPGVGDIEIYANTDRQGIWLAWLDNEPVGCIAAVTYNPGYAFIGLFAVKSEYQGQGLGRRLWEHALETLSNVDCIGLEAAVQMVSFYEKAGFEKDCVTNAMKSARGPISLNSGCAIRPERCLWPWMARVNAMATCAFAPVCSPLAKAGGWARCWQKKRPWHRCC